MGDMLLSEGMWIGGPGEHSNVSKNVAGVRRKVSW